MKYSLQQPEGTYNIAVHRVIWVALKGEIPDGYTVDHIDGYKDDNRIENLQLLTAEENAIKGNARHWTVTSPEGIVHSVYNLQEFCRVHELHKSHLYSVAKGTYKTKSQTYKGWKCHAY